MVMYKVFYTPQAIKQIKSYLRNTPLKYKVKKLIEIIKSNPYQALPTYEKLTKRYKNTYSRRVNVRHRLVYKVIEDKKAIKILSVWNYYGI